MDTSSINRIAFWCGFFFLETPFQEVIIGGWKMVQYYQIYIPRSCCENSGHLVKNSRNLFSEQFSPRTRQERGGQVKQTEIKFGQWLQAVKVKVGWIQTRLQVGNRNQFFLALCLDPIVLDHFLLLHFLGQLSWPFSLWLISPWL